MVYKDIFKCFLSIFIVFLFITCSTVEKDDPPIVIKDVKISKTQNKAPKESDFQIDLELSALMDEDNLYQDIDYRWVVEDLKMDILQSTKEIFDRTSDLFFNNYKRGVYFIDISKERSKSLLSLYVAGYYRVTLVASNINETKYHSVIIKAGKPKLIPLYLKINIPPAELSKDFNNFNGKEGEKIIKGSLFYTLYNGEYKNNITKDDLYEFSPKDMTSDWYGTNILLDPYLSFGVEAGSFVAADGKYLHLGNVTKGGYSSGNIRYDYKDDKGLTLKNSPLILNKFKTNTVFSIYKDGIKWFKGELSVNSLIWGNDDDGNDTFTYSEEFIDNNNPKIVTYFDNKYLAKIFVGSVSYKISKERYYVSFGPEGTDMEELDLAKKRDFTGLPFGYLLGKVGIGGTPFPIGTSYYYSPTLSGKVYEVLETNSSIKLPKDDIFTTTTTTLAPNMTVNTTIKDNSQNQNPTKDIDKYSDDTVANENGKSSLIIPNNEIYDKGENNLDITSDNK